MKRIIAIILILALLLTPSVAYAAHGIEVTSKAGDGVWYGDTWKVSIYPGETKATTLALYNPSDDSLRADVMVAPSSLDGGNLVFWLRTPLLPYLPSHRQAQLSFTIRSGQHTAVVLRVEASTDATPGIYTTQLRIRSELPSPPTTPIDITPPRIYGVWLCDVSETTADICWTTNEKSTSQVKYWTSPSILSSLDKTLITKHQVGLTRLTPGTTYRYRVMSEDKRGNLAISDKYTFTTLEKEKPTPSDDEEEPENGEEPIKPEDEEIPPKYIPWALIGGVLAGLGVTGGLGFWFWQRKVRRGLNE